ncbi:uncharacterized protein LOC134761792 isoform X2 [Pongo abelii]|uniref:uncharacterized protein LOC134761792 isoform X2 n=1 Tax=Pongo abelii TaxID=9601 RepID=UPI00300697BD
MGAPGAEPAAPSRLTPPMTPLRAGLGGAHLFTHLGGRLCTRECGLGGWSHAGRVLEESPYPLHSTSDILPWLKEGKGL